MSGQLRVPRTFGSDSPYSFVSMDSLETVRQIKVYDASAGRGSPQPREIFDPTKRESWFDACRRALQEMNNLKKGWDGYDADPPNEVAERRGMEVLDALLELEKFQPARLSPSVEGGVVFSFFSRDLYADIECFNSGEVVAVTSKPHEEPTVWEVGTPGNHSLLESLEQIADFLGE